MVKKVVSIPKAMIIALTIIIAVFILFYNKLPPQIPLFYSLSEGDEAIVDTWLIFLLPAISFILVLFNSFLKRKFFTDNILLEQIFYYCNLFIIITTTVIFLRIIFLVT